MMKTDKQKHREFIEEKMREFLTGNKVTQLPEVEELHPKYIKRKKRNRSTKGRTK